MDRLVTYAAGDRVVVRTELGEQEGTVTGQAELAPGEEPWYATVHVRFDDGTESGWAPFRVRRVEDVL